MKITQKSDAPAEKKREDWMTELPPELGLGLNAALSNRSFSSKGNKGRGDGSSWTDTPADKQRKLEETMRQQEVDQQRKAYYAMMKAQSGQSGRPKKKKSESKDSSEQPPEAMPDRPQPPKRKSLLEMHQEKLVTEKKKQGSKPIAEFSNIDPELLKPFDRETDLMTNRINPQKRSEIFQQARDLGSRFLNTGAQSSFL
eukprot:TRINITY_DN21583_c0_g1_i8.p1 TRINITY_DN21583_c0_g1~~TRINITY_DN21583_c0_g1_i8.p1  ORF type:complete len:199 (-),score=27.82 TRINITY_DN21583_c0_g1_i8:37-633(-)